MYTDLHSVTQRLVDGDMKTMPDDNDGPWDVQ